MKKIRRKSAGILLYRIQDTVLQVFLAHPGGPFWANKDNGVWTIPKGEFNEGETPLEAAKREFEEETGTRLTGEFLELTPVVQKAGKQVYAWAIEGTIDPDTIRCNTYKIQWPPNSGQWKSYPEIDTAAWYTTEEAKEKINEAQVAFIDELVLKLSGTKLLEGNT